MTTVLLVEDDPDQLHIRQLVFERSGYTVRTAQNANDALALAAGCDVVLMDLRLPQLEDGLRLIQSLQGSARIIVLTGDISDRELNVDLQLRKPCSSRVLLDAVASLVK
jgi:DNA-binding response OmpR family regulator